MAANRFEMPVVYPPDAGAVIRMRGIRKTFHTAAGETTVLRDVDVDIHLGQFVGVVGRSGSGKSTLVNMITGIDRPTAGVVEVGDRHIHNLAESDMAVWRGKNLGIVFQFFQLLPMLTLIENVMLPMDFCNMYSPASREERAHALLRRVGLDGMAHKLPGAVAGGQQQSAAVARALANDPPILIADEPTGNLDSTTAEQVIQIFEELAAQGKTILIVTHDRVLARRTNRLLLISDGELVNEHLAAAFADAPHPRLLALSRSAAELHLDPGQPLPEAPRAAAPLYLVTAGAMLEDRAGEVARLGYGSLLNPLQARRALRAGESGAHLLVLPREMAAPMLEDAGQQVALPQTRDERPHPLYRWLGRGKRGA